MKQVAPIDRPRKFQPSLEGVRGFGMLLVFCGHYFENGQTLFGHIWWLYPLFLVRETAWVVLPAFFVLSGYLICGILIDTREQEGYFRIFYTRRILRVFPVYYLTLLGVTAYNLMRGIKLSPQFWAHYFYIHNLFPGYDGRLHWVPLNQVIHLWSMAVEEQFYLVWPLVVWFCRSKRALLRATWALIAVSFALRFAAPLIHVSSLQEVRWTPTCMDAILLGVLMAITKRDAIYAKLEPYAKYAFVAGVGLLITITITTGGADPNGYRRDIFLIPAGNLIAAALIMAIIERGSLLNRVCSQKWACWFGARSYSFYLFHYTYHMWFLTVATQWLARYLPFYPALLLSVAAAFCFTLILACVSYRYVEQPLMNVKKRMRYGAPAKPDQPLHKMREAVAIEATGTSRRG